MKTIYKTLILAVLLLNAIAGFSRTWETVSRGYWSSASVWKDGEVPFYSSSADTFLINHPLVIDSTLIFKNSCYLYIDSSGGICGHEKMIFSGGKMAMYGVLELDSLMFNTAAKGECRQPGHVILTEVAVVSGPGPTSMVVTCSFKVGPWFECKQPEYDYLMGIEEPGMVNGFEVYPNPSSGQTKIRTRNELKSATLRMYNSVGKLVKEIANISGNSLVIERDGLANGIYTIVISGDKEIPVKSVIQIIE